MSAAATQCEQLPLSRVPRALRAETHVSAPCAQAQSALIADSEIAGTQAEEAPPKVEHKGRFEVMDAAQADS